MNSAIIINRRLGRDWEEGNRPFFINYSYVLWVIIFLQKSMVSFLSIEQTYSEIKNKILNES